MTGFFIAFEGGEGTGKSTQARLFKQMLTDSGFDAVLTREPGGTPGAEAIRQLLLDPPGEGWDAEAEALLFAASRSDHVAKLIRPALARGAWVICDRFVDSSRAYQGGAGGLGDEAISQLHAFGSSGLRPDLTILLQVDEATLEARLTARDGGQSDAIGGRGLDYHRAVADSFSRLAERDPDGFAVLDGVGSPEEVHARVLEAVTSRLSVSLVGE